MFSLLKRKFKSYYLLNYTILLAVIWTITILSFLFYDFNRLDEEAINNARAYAEVAFNKDVIYRKWNALHGGVYVSVTEETPPNPYLSHVPDRDLVTHAGKKLTLINPAYMTRQIFELEEEQEGLRGHITSLKPIRPENKPDTWETTALEAFENGVKEVASIEKFEGKDYFRMMKPFITEEECLKCHALHGYKLNDIRGGISVSIPLDKMLNITSHSKLSHSNIFILLWVVGLISLIIGYFKIRKNEMKRLESERALESAYDDLENKVEERTRELSKINQEREELGHIINKSNSIVFLWKAVEGWPVEYVSDNISLFGYSPNDFYAKKISYIDLIHPNDVERVGQEVKSYSESGASEFAQEYRIITKSGDICFTEDHTWIRRNEQDEITHYQGMVIDVTKEKKAEERFRAIIEQAGDAFYLSDFDGNIIEVNNQAVHTMGYTRDEFLKMKVGDLDSVYIDLEKQRAFWNNLEPGKPITLETYHKRKDGTEFPVEIRVGLTEFKDEKAIIGFARNITERKQVNAELLIEKEFSEKIIETSNAVIVGLDKNHIIRIFNKGVESITGYKKTEVIGKDWFDIFFPADISDDMNKVWKDAWGTSAHSYVNQILTKKGEKKIISWQTTGMYEDENSAKHLLLSIGEDITERKLVEDALHETQVFNKTLLETSPDLIYVYDIIDRKNIYSNQGIMKILNYSVDEIQKMGENILPDLMHPDDFDNYLKEIIPQYQTAKDGEIIEHEYRMKHKDGTWKWLQSKESIFTRLDDGIPKQIFGLTADITERKRAEELLIHSHDLMSYVIEHSNSAVAVHDKNLNYLYVSKNYLEQYKVEEKNVIGKHHYDVFPDLPQKWRDIHQKALHGEISSADDDPYEREDGIVEWTKWECRPWYESDDSIGGIIIYTEVITERKNMELALQKSYDELEIKVDERTKELSQANIKLQELDKLKSMFIASMSHELRTPLNSIIGFTGLILQGISGRVDVEARKDLDIVYNSSQHLLSLINDVIDISKIEADKLDIHFENMKLDDIIEEIISTVSKEAERKKLKIKTEFPIGLTINSDRTRLFQCILNLMNNAVKFTEKGVVKLKIDKTVNVLKITVTDTGVGIKKKDITKLFKSFIRLDSPLKEDTLGTGLGLYLTQKIVTNVFNGEISVESKYGKGSTFTLEIPLKKA